MGKLSLPKGGNIKGIVCVYFLNGQLCIRSASTLSSKRVKTSPEFKNTMINAGLMAKASRIGSMIYKTLPDKKRKHARYRRLTGRAMKYLKKGHKEEDVIRLLKEIII